MGTPSNIVAFWRLVEWLTPTSFPKTSPKRDEREPIYDIRTDSKDDLPWQPDHPHTIYRCAQASPGITEDNHREKWAYGIYAGLININTAREEIESWLGEKLNHVVRDERQPLGTSAVGFQVDSAGCVIAETLVLSSFAWAFGALRKQAAQGRTTLHANALKSEDFADANGVVYDRFASELSGAELTSENLYRFLAWLFGYLGLATQTLTPTICRVQCVRRPVTNTTPATQTDNGAHTQTEPPSPRLTAALEMLNSLFLDDLALVQHNAESGDIGEALAHYLGKRPPRHIDLRKEHQEAWALLAPVAYPPGRWPTKNRYPLVFSQQLAVNQALHSLGGGGSGLMAVNGPPGTGKTTLLKDIVAGIIIERAQILARFSSPSDAFGKSRPAWQSGEWRQFFAPLDASLLNFGIVVASSNNGAVENVTLEFPKAADVDPEWGDRKHSPFTEIGSRLLGDTGEAWSLLAACLGKSKNKTAFADAFWGWEQKKSEDDPVHIPDLLKGPRPANVPGWRQAVASFQKALDEEQACRYERQHVYQAVTTIRQIEQDIAALQHREQTLAAELAQAEQQRANALERQDEHKATLEQAFLGVKSEREAVLKSAERDLESQQNYCSAAEHSLQGVQQQLEHCREDGPSTVKRWWSKWLRTLSSVKAWQNTLRMLSDQEVAARQQVSESLKRKALALNACNHAEQQLNHSALSEAVATERQQYQRSEATTKEAAKHCEQVRTQLTQQQAARATAEKKALAAYQTIDTYCEKVGHRYCVTPDLLTECPKTKELASPWADPEWESARVRVFLAALDLHDAFVLDAGKPLQNNLRGMMQLLRGKAPNELPEGVAESLWSSLFLLVPVVSTTFASFGRQFAELGRESLGWLMVDEAGQAAPQQSAGALWRAKSALVVGDPLQLTPVVTVPDRLQGSLAESLGVSMEWLPGSTSTQALADQASLYGSTIGTTWVGAPLLVHRRCDSPMFEICNEVAYDNAMVHGKPCSNSSLFESAWVDVPAEQADGHWVPNEGRAAKALIERLIEQDVTADDIFLISPFRAVVKKLHQVAANYPGIKAGTIHTVQGKEAKVVILVLGGNPQKAGAKDWASATPNLLNVAVSRAKLRLFVIGAREDWARYPYFGNCAEWLPTLSADSFQKMVIS
ncbi:MULTISPECIES: ATP-binding protein [unclassified Halomonas]|uniref:DEAD/DEAH box helicase n=1 Tax=unclassified Halomonas TaxID=2609666 RepID=UPI0007D9814C|nr:MULTISPECIES: ATP-binding protein [unclassified Halomonas]MBT2786406.1 hypothetical protein [Halomonas sp. ISL-106]MBT2797428.1 hypothetical protein [Halomonas sp. ISL-104]OAL58792.1 hypothetical protein A6R74_07860 [Halomonas sp. ALS9]